MAENSKLRICIHCGDSIGCCQPTQCKVCDKISQCGDSMVLTSTLCDFCKEIALETITKNCSFDEILHLRILNSHFAFLLVNASMEELLAEEDAEHEKVSANNKILLQRQKLAEEMKIANNTLSCNLKSIRETLAKQRLQFAA